MISTFENPDPTRDSTQPIADFARDHNGTIVIGYETSLDLVIFGHGLGEEHFRRTLMGHTLHILKKGCLAKDLWLVISPDSSPATTT